MTGALTGDLRQCHKDANFFGQRTFISPEHEASLRSSRPRSTACSKESRIRRGRQRRATPPLTPHFAAPGTWRSALHLTSEHAHSARGRAAVRSYGCRRSGERLLGPWFTPKNSFHNKLSCSTKGSARRSLGIDRRYFCEDSSPLSSCGNSDAEGTVGGQDLANFGRGARCCKPAPQTPPRRRDA